MIAESDIFLPMLLAASSTGGAADGTGQLRFHQGVVVAWDVIAGTNTVRINGNPFTNLRTLMGPEANLIRAGDTVAILAYQTTYFVFGRVSAAGGDQRALGIGSGFVFTGQSTGTAPWVDLATPGPAIDVYIGSSRRCLVFTSAEISSTQTTGYMGFQVSGASTIGPNTFTPASLGSSGTSLVGTATMVSVVSAANGLNEGVNTFTAKYGCLSSGGTIATFLSRRLTVLPF
jgi:hypothetical protein